MRIHYHEIYMKVKGQSARSVIYIFFIPHHAGPTPSPSKKLNTGEGHQSADYRGEHAQHYKDSLCLLVGSVIRWIQLGTGEEFQCADNPDEHDEHYITSLHSLVGSPVVKMVSFVLQANQDASDCQTSINASKNQLKTSSQG